jgi:hypothetical protein
MTISGHIVIDLILGAIVGFLLAAIIAAAVKLIGYE